MIAVKMSEIYPLNLFHFVSQFRKLIINFIFSLHIIFSCSIEKDVIEKITFSTSNGRAGELKFSYLQDIDEAGNEFVEPDRKARLTEKSKGISWFLELIRNN